MSRGAGGSGCPIPGLAPPTSRTAAPKLLQPPPYPSSDGSRAFPEMFPSAASPKARESGVLPLPLVPVPAGLCRYHWHRRWCAGGVPRSFLLYCWAKATGVSREGIPARRDATDVMDWGQARCHWRRQPGDGGDGVTDGETTCRRGSVGTRCQPRVFWPEQDPCSLNKQVGREEGCNRW